MIAYKFLSAGRTGFFSGFAWPPAGEWVVPDGPVVDCLRGIHALRFEELLDWIDDELWEIELDGTVAERDGMLIAERGRLVRRIEGWNEEVASTFARSCATRAAALAATALRRLRLDDEARRLENARDAEELGSAATAALESASHDPAVVELVGFAGDLVSLASGQRPDVWRGSAPAPVAQSQAVIAANAAFVTAHAAGRAAVADAGTEDAYAAGFGAERLAQLSWFRALL